MNGASYEWSMRVRDFDLANQAREAASAAKCQEAEVGIVESTHPRDASGRFVRTHEHEGKEE